MLKNEKQKRKKAPPKWIGNEKFLHAQNLKKEKKKKKKLTFKSSQYLHLWAQDGPKYPTLKFDTSQDVTLSSHEFT